MESLKTFSVSLVIGYFQKIEFCVKSKTFFKQGLDILKNPHPPLNIRNLTISHLKLSFEEKLDMRHVPKAVSKSGRLIVVEILFLTMFLTFHIFHDISICTLYTRKDRYES